MKILPLLLASAICSFTGSSDAQSLSGHYPPGAEGFLAGTTPPPGLYTKVYNFFYWADEFTGGHGQSVDPNFHVFSYTAAVRQFWITDVKIFGADYGMDFALLMTDNELKYSTPGGIGHSSTTGFGDMLFQPLLLGWHGAQWDIGALYGMFIPTGKFDQNDPATVGHGSWSHIVGLGGTWYPDKEKAWSMSIANRLEFNTENSDLNITPGAHYSMEWGIARRLASTWEVGAVGSILQKVSDDSGSGVNYDASVHDRVYSVGGEVTKFFPSAKIQLSLRWLHEFDAIARPQGDAIWFSIAKIW